MTQSLAARIDASLRVIPDFPSPGILFRDITPLLADATLFAEVIDAMCNDVSSSVTHIVGIESRGFIFGVPIAMALKVAFVPVRKPGKLPHQRISESYVLEYRTDTLEMHVDALDASSRVLIVDDVLATGGTAVATARLVERAGARVAGISVLAEIGVLGGRERLSGYRVSALVSV
jgi:adenine phosphoribosyltransferase